MCVHFNSENESTNWRAAVCDEIAETISKCEQKCYNNLTEEIREHG